MLVSNFRNPDLEYRFANMESLKEISRVLKPGGGLGLIWNLENCKANHPFPDVVANLQNKIIRGAIRSLLLFGRRGVRK